MNIPYLRDEEILQRADHFLEEYHPSLTIPIPIEEIIELKLGMSILPVRNLEKDCEVDGSIGKDFKTILIDAYVFEHNTCRARFTLAHELGHNKLHKILFQQNGGFDNYDGFIDFQNGLTDKEHKRMEIQAFRFAEGILFPRVTLNSVIKDAVENLGGFDALTVNDIEKITSVVASKFDVSYKAATNKINRDYKSLIEALTADIPF